MSVNLQTCNIIESAPPSVHFILEMLDQIGLGFGTTNFPYLSFLIVIRSVRMSHSTEMPLII